MTTSGRGLIAIRTAVQGRWSSFWACHAELDPPAGTFTKVGRGCSPAKNANGLIGIAIESDAPWMWFLDDDQTFQPDTLTRLLRHFADPEIEAVVPLSFRRQPPFKALWFQGEGSEMLCDLPAPGFVPLTASTFGGLLVRGAALRRLTRPYVALGQMEGSDEWNDDLFFCRNLRRTGTQLWGDSTVRMGHTTDVEVWPHWDQESQSWQTVLARGLQPFLAQPWGSASLVSA